MIKVWFLIALITTIDQSAIKYHGIGAYNTIEECEVHQIQYENFLTEYEIRLGKKAVWVESYCLPFHSFERKKDV